MLATYTRRMRSNNQEIKIAGLSVARNNDKLQYPCNSGTVNIR